MIRLWNRVEPIFLLLGIFTVAFDAVFTALRLRVLHLANQKHSYPGYLTIVVLHGYFLLLLPARLGEIPYLLMMRRRLGMASGAVFASFVYQRVLDTIILGIFFFTGLAVIFDQGVIGFNWLVLTMVLVSILIVLFARLDWVIAQIVRSFYHIEGRHRLWVRTILYVLITAQRWSVLLRNRRWEALILSIIRWTFVMAGTWFAFRGFGFHLGIAETLFLGAGLAFVSVIPLQTIGGFGVSEVGLAGLLMVIGFSWQEATTTALTVRFTIFAMQVAGLSLAGAGAWLIERLIVLHVKSEEKFYL